MKYSLDASSIIRGRYTYPPRHFPGLWLRVEALIDGRQLVASVHVEHQLEDKDEEAFEWASQQANLFVEDQDDEIVKEVFHYPNFKFGPGDASPFVIALAKLHGLTVVTQENLSPSPAKPHIPNVCQALGVPFTNLLGLIEEERWEFA